MFISQALTKVKNLKSKLARADKIIEGCAVHYEDVAPEYSYGLEMVSRIKLINEITDIKTQIQLTNTVTLVVWLGQTITLAKLILVNADLRSELAFIQKQLDIQLEASDGWRQTTRSKDDIKKVYADGYDKNSLRNELENLENLKEKIDGLMNSVNASTTLA